MNLYSYIPGIPDSTQEHLINIVQYTVIRTNNKYNFFLSEDEYIFIEITENIFHTHIQQYSMNIG